MKFTVKYKILFGGINRAKVKELGSFSAVFVIERVLTGFLPLIILYLTNEGVYTRLEFIFSVATVLLPLSDLLTRMYFFYGYFVSEQKESYLRISVSIFCGQIVLILLASLCCLLFQEVDLFYALMRLGYLSLYFFLFDYLRIDNKQDKLIRDSIIISCCIILFAAVDHFLIHSKLLFPFIAAMQLAYIFYRLNGKRNMITLPPATEIWAFLKKCFRYSFPVFLNVGIAVFIQNYLKVHFYKTDNEQMMLVLSLLLRLGMSIQIIHALLQSYFSKRIFLKEIAFKKFFTGIYLPLILLAAFGLSFAEVIYFTYINKSIPAGNFTTLLVNLYFLLWCTSAIMEILFTSSNRTIWLLAINIFSLVCTFLIFFLLNLSHSSELNQLVALMCFQPALFILFTAFFYKKILPKTELIVNSA